MTSSNPIPLAPGAAPVSAPELEALASELYSWRPPWISRRPDRVLGTPFTDLLIIPVNKKEDEERSWLSYLGAPAAAALAAGIAVQGGLLLLAKAIGLVEVSALVGVAVAVGIGLLALPAVQYRRLRARLTEVPVEQRRPAFEAAKHTRAWFSWCPMTAGFVVLALAGFGYYRATRPPTLHGTLSTLEESGDILVERQCGEGPQCDVWIQLTRARLARHDGAIVFKFDGQRSFIALEHGTCGWNVTEETEVDIATQVGALTRHHPQAYSCPSVGTGRIPALHVLATVSDSSSWAEFRDIGVVVEPQ